MFAVEEQKRLQMIEVLTSGAGMHCIGTGLSQGKEMSGIQGSSDSSKNSFSFYKGKNLAQWYLGRNDV